MRAMIPVGVFVLLIIGLFVWFGRSVPQLSRSTTAPVVIGQSAVELTAAGKTIFERENSCLTCHSIGEDPQARCPNLEEVWIQAATRQPELSAAEYLVQSVYDPNAYIVDGYPRNQMKPINIPPIGLTDDEIKAVLCYLVSLSTDLGPERAREIEIAQEPYRQGMIAVAQATGGLTWPEGDPEEGEYVFEDMKCLKCHVVAGRGGSDDENIGPDLSNIGSIQTSEYLAESLLDPNAVIVRGKGYTSEGGSSKMPEYNDTMTLRELLDIVAYLTTLRGSETGTRQEN